MTPEHVSPLEGGEPTEKARRALDRLKETLGVEALPRGFEILAGCEAGMLDLSATLARQMESGALNRCDKALIAAAVASATGSASATELFGTLAVQFGSDRQHVQDTLGVATIMGVFNGYFRFRELAEDTDFSSFRANFNASVLQKSSLTKQQTELIAIAVSNKNACGLCVPAHIKKALEADVSRAEIDEAVKVGSLAQSIAQMCLALG